MRTPTTVATSPAHSDAAAPGGPPTADNPLRGRFNSWLLQAYNGTIERETGPLRDEIVAAAGGAGEVVEIGPGNGPLFGRLRAGTRLHAIEPNRHFHDRLRASADHAGIDLVLHEGGAEAIDLPDASVDAVLGTWVLCTVGDPQQVLTEIRRVLRPGGRFAFIEHIVGPEGSAVRRVQDSSGCSASSRSRSSPRS
jgi:SAM-dependent methyltransferase